MITEELIQYIKSQIQNGEAMDVIKTNLTAIGWLNADIKTAFQAVTTKAPDSSPTIQPANFLSPTRVTKSFPIKSVIVIVILLILFTAGIFIFGSFAGKKTVPDKNTYNSQTPPSSVVSVPAKTSGEYEALVKSIMDEGWNKATFSPSPGGHGTPYTFYIPPTFIGQRGDQLSPQNSIDTIDQKVTSGQAEAFDQVAQLSSVGFQPFETMVQGAIPFSKQQPVVTDFTTASGLNGKKISALGELFNNSVQFTVILLHTGKQSDLGQEIVIKVNGTSSYAGGSGHGTYTGSVDVIDKIAQTINL